MTAALTDTEQDLDADAERVRKNEPGLYAKIERRINDGRTPEQVNEWFDWPDGSKFGPLCLNTARWLYYRELARKALEKAGTK